MRILLVDDEKIIRDGLQQLIDWEGIGCTRFVTADSATKALELLEREAFDLIITDIYMKKMTGIELARKIKISKPNIKVIILSAYEDFSYARAAIEAGVIKYLLKPIDPRELEQAVFEAVEQLATDTKLQNQVIESEKIVTIYRPQLAKDFWKALLRKEISSREDLKHRIQLAGISPQLEGLCCLLVTAEGGGGFQLHEIETAASVFADQIDCVRQTPGELAVILSGVPTGNQILDLKKILERNGTVKVRTACGRYVKDIMELYQSAEDARMALESSDRRGQEGETLVAQSVQLIEKRLREEEFGVNDIANDLHVSASYFSRIFKKQMGVTCIEYITHKRIEKAKKLLEHTDMKQQYIAESVGYSNAYYFSMMFKKQTGETPGQYRKRLGRSDV